MGNLFEEVLLIRSAVPPRVLNLITFFSAITVCFQVAIKTVSWQSLLRLEPFSLKNTRSFTQSIDVLMTDSLNQNSARRNTLPHPPPYACAQPYYFSLQWFLGRKRGYSWLPLRQWHGCAHAWYIFTIPRRL